MLDGDWSSDVCSSDLINTAVAQMDEMTQQNAALVEESSAAASSLHAQANGLLDAVSVFQLRSSGSAAVNPLNHKD
jgi:methyl-accepting chemotaxis protein